MRMTAAGTIVDDGTSLVAQTRLDRYRVAILRAKRVACIAARLSHQQLAAVHAERIYHLRRGTKRASA